MIIEEMKQGERQVLVKWCKSHDSGQHSSAIIVGFDSLHLDVTQADGTITSFSSTEALLAWAGY